MKALDFERMEFYVGGKLTQEEIETFFGAASCVMAVSSLGGAIFGSWGCYKFIKSLF